jgi:AraC-like DNA-binding protein
MNSSYSLISIDPDIESLNLIREIQYINRQEILNKLLCKLLYFEKAIIVSTIENDLILYELGIPSYTEKNQSRIWLYGDVNKLLTMRYNTTSIEGFIIKIKLPFYYHLIQSSNYKYKTKFYYDLNLIDETLSRLLIEIVDGEGDLYTKIDLINQAIKPYNSYINTSFCVIYEFIIEKRGNVKVYELIDRFGKSYKTIEILFLKNIGMRPIEFIKRIRFVNVCKDYLILKKDIFQIIEEYGYTDQNHLIKDFNKYCHFSPVKLSKANLEIIII